MRTTISHEQTRPDRQDFSQAAAQVDKVQQVNVSGTINIILRVHDSAHSVDTGLLAQSAATATRTHTTLGIRYEMKM